MDDWPTERESTPRGGVEEIIERIRSVREFLLPAHRPMVWIRVGYRNLSYLPPDMEEKQGF